MTLNFFFLWCKGQQTREVKGINFLDKMLLNNQVTPDQLSSIFQPITNFKATDSISVLAPGVAGFMLVLFFLSKRNLAICQGF